MKNKDLRVLVVGGGGREHAMVRKIKSSPMVGEVYCAPGNAGTKIFAKNIPIKANEIDRLRQLALDLDIDFTVVGPEEPLVMGIVDSFRIRGLPIFGPSKEAAMLEGSKLFAKKVMKSAGVLTGDYMLFDDHSRAIRYLRKIKNWPVVVKADGLAAGKGVEICASFEEASKAVSEIMIDMKHGEAGKLIIIEEYLTGEEASYIVMTDGTNIIPMASSQDHKRQLDNDQGPNTGGMGAYSPAPVVTRKIERQIIDKIITPVLRHMDKEKIPFRGALYAGLMIKDGVAKVLEFNVRMGDPETQPILARLESDIMPILLGCAEGDLNPRMKNYAIKWDERVAVSVVKAAEGYPGSPVKGDFIEGLESFPHAFAYLDHAGTINDGHVVKTNGGRVCSITALGHGYAKAIANTYKMISRIHFRGEQFRTDIGARALNR